MSDEPIGNWIEAKDTGGEFGLSVDEVADLVKVVDALMQLSDDLSEKTQLGFELTSDSDFLFHNGKYGSEGMSLTVCTGSNNADDEYLSLGFYFHADSLSTHKLSHSEKFPHNVCLYIADEIHDLYLCENAVSDEQEKFARRVYDSLYALAEKGNLESKFGRI